MVMAQNRHTIKLVFGNNYSVEMALENTLNPSQQMTGLLFAIEQMKELSAVQELTLMFDEENQTNEEEILEQGLTEVLVKAKQESGRGFGGFGGGLSMADMIRQQQEAPEETTITEEESKVPSNINVAAGATSIGFGAQQEVITAKFYINGKAQLIKMT